MSCEREMSGWSMEMNAPQESDPPQKISQAALFEHPLRMNRIHRTQFDHERLDHECFDYLSRETYSKHRVGTRAF